jgi:hypothetical protein
MMKAGDQSTLGAPSRFRSWRYWMVATRIHAIWVRSSAIRVRSRASSSELSLGGVAGATALIVGPGVEPATKAAEAPGRNRP